MDDDDMFEWMIFNELTHHVKYRFLDLRMQYYVWNKAVREARACVCDRIWTNCVASDMHLG